MLFWAKQSQQPKEDRKTAVASSRAVKSKLHQKPAMKERTGKFPLFKEGDVY
ncbi:hypothetical protein TWF696_004010 [Orbilia brochopaga]|uniref:Uncharacterized protein n=1 Tax=Orbilia brochopaga TaxID=3140254 RepID=A0AAV9V7W3_9PEZI